MCGDKEALKENRYICKRKRERERKRFRIVRLRKLRYKSSKIWS